MAHTIKRPLQVRPHNRVKILLRHAHQKAVLCNPRIIHKNINTPVLLNPGLYQLPGALKIRHVTLHGLSPASVLLNLPNRILRPLGRTVIIYNHRSPCSRQSPGNLPANPPAGPGNHRHLTCQHPFFSFSIFRLSPNHPVSLY